MTDPDKTPKVSIALQPFAVPNFVRAVSVIPGKREDGFKEIPAFHLSEIDAETLGSMCDVFRASVFLKAGKKDE